MTVCPESIRHHTLEENQRQQKAICFVYYEEKETPNGYPVETTLLYILPSARICFSKYHNIGILINDNSP